MNTFIDDGIIVLELCHAYPRRFGVFGVRSLSSAVQPPPYQIVDCDDDRWHNMFDVKCVKTFEVQKHPYGTVTYYFCNGYGVYSRLTKLVNVVVHSQCEWFE